MSLIRDLIFRFGVDGPSWSQFRASLGDGKEALQELAATATTSGDKLDEAFQGVGRSATVMSQAAQQFSLFGEQASGALGEVNAQLSLFDTKGIAAVDEAFGSLAVTASDSLSPALAEASASEATFIETATEGLATLGELQEAVLGLVSAVAGVEIFRVVVEWADQFELATKTIVADTGATGDALASLKGTFDQVFTEVPQGAQEVASVIGILNQRLGETGPELSELATQILDLARISGESSSQIATDSARMFASWKVPEEDRTQLLDFFNAVREASGASIGELESDVTRFGSALREFGFSIEDAASMIGDLEKAGIPAETAIMGLQKALLSMSKAGIADPIEGLEQLQQAIRNASSEGEAFQIGAAAFGRGAAAITEAIRSGSLDFQNLQGNLALTSETIREQGERVATLADDWGKFWNHLKADAEPVLDFAIGGLARLLDWADKVVNALKDIPRLLPSFDTATGGALGDQTPAVLGTGSGEAGKEGDALRDLASATGDYANETQRAVTVTADFQNWLAHATAGISQMHDGLRATVGDVTEFGTSFGDVNTRFYSQWQSILDLMGKMPQTLAGFQEALSQGFNLNRAEDELQRAIDKANESGLAFSYAGQQIIGALQAEQQQLRDFASDSVWQLYQDKLDELTLRISDDTAKANQSFEKFLMTFNAAALKQPIDDIAGAFDRMGIGARKGFDDTAAQAQQDFALIAQSGIVSEADVEQAWRKFQSDMAKLGKDSVDGLNALVAASGELAAKLESLGAPLERILQVQAQQIQYQMELNSLEGASADTQLMLQERLEAINVQQRLLYEQTNALSDLYKNVTKVFSDTWTEFGTHLGDAIAGTESFGKAWSSTITDIEKKLAELVTNFLLGQLKDAILADTGALQDFNKLFNSLFGIAGGGGASATSAAASAGGTAAAGAASGAGQSGALASSQVGTMLSSTLNVITGILDVINGIIQDFQLAHMEKTLGQIETNTRELDMFIGSGLVPDTHLLALAVTDIRNYELGTLSDYLHTMAGDLDGIKGDLDQMLGAGTDVGSSTESYQSQVLGYLSDLLSAADTSESYLDVIATALAEGTGLSTSSQQSQQLHAQAESAGKVEDLGNAAGDASQSMDGTALSAKALSQNLDNVGAAVGRHGSPFGPSITITVGQGGGLGPQPEGSGGLVENGGLPQASAPAASTFSASPFQTQLGSGGTGLPENGGLPQRSASGPGAFGVTSPFLVVAGPGGGAFPENGGLPQASATGPGSFGFTSSFGGVALPSPLAPAPGFGSIAGVTGVTNASAGVTVNLPGAVISSLQPAQQLVGLFISSLRTQAGLRI